MSDDTQPAVESIVKQESTTVIPNRKPKTEIAPYVLGGFVLAIYFCIALMLIFINIQEGSKAAVHELTTTLRDAFMVFIMWMYGTTKSGERKTDLIAKGGPVDPS